MDKQEKTKRIKNLDDIKRIRFNTGRLNYCILIFGCFLTSIIFFISSFLFIKFNMYLLGGVFVVIGYIFLILEIHGICNQDKVEKEFLIKYGTN